MKSDIPAHAIERVTKRHRNGAKAAAYYFLRGAKIGWRWWNENGQAAQENPMRRGRYHGVCREWYEDGSRLWESRFVNGREHGVAKQWDCRGRLIGTYRMRHGTGTEKWHVPINGRKSPLWGERHYVKGVPHGIERHWYGKRIVEQCHWKHGLRHGFWDKWHVTGRRKQGYPKYYLRDKQVTESQYLKLCKTDRTLPQPD